MEGGGDRAGGARSSVALAPATDARDGRPLAKSSEKRGAGCDASAARGGGAHPRRAPLVQARGAAGVGGGGASLQPEHERRAERARRLRR
eukprot:6192977-Pleurochrysis_carterae.AAC.2